MTTKTKNAQILDEFDISEPVFKNLGTRLRDLLNQLVQAADVEVHTIEMRCKSRDSLRGKLARVPDRYSSLNEITDLVGLRVITHYTSDVDAVAEIIESQFEIDWENSIDKRAVLKPDQFGYLSLHFVASLSDQRSTLPENQPFAGLRFEVQIRTVLQHAWAEIEHDLGYKSTAAVPAVVRRRFSRLAGLLELADEEFLRLRKDLKEYQDKVAEGVKDRPADVPIDDESLAALMEDSMMLELTQEIGRRTGMLLLEEEFGTYPPIKLDFARRLRHLGLQSIQDVLDRFEEFYQTIVAFAVDWLGPPDDEREAYLTRSIGFFYLVWVLAGDAGDLEATRELVMQSRPTKSAQGVEEFSQRVMDTFKKVTGSGEKQEAG